ncbi:MAG: hypothetical protein QW292_08620 [Candidatus Parvarchaeota archaeon]
MMRKLYYSPKEMVLVEKFNNEFSVLPALQSKGTMYAYLYRIRETGEQEFEVCNEKLVRMYEDPSLIYVQEIADLIDSLKKKGIIIKLGDPAEMIAYLQGWLKSLDNLLRLYQELVAAVKLNADTVREAMKSMKVDAILSKQPNSVQSIYSFLVSRTNEWYSKYGFTYGVPLSMIVNEVKLKEDTVRGYLKLLEHLNLVKVNVKDKKDYYLPIEG